MEAASLTRETSDETLVAATRAGDDRAFEQLYERYQRRISAYVLGMVKDHGRAEDVTQEVFISALRRMRQTDRPIAFKPWVYEIARNACIDQFRRSRRADEVSCDADDGVGPTLVSTGPTPDMALQSKQQLADLQGAFGGLSAAHHRILVMRELEGLSYSEIGERLGMTKPAVESTLFRARKRLGEEYEELVSGERCVRVQGIIARAETGRLGARDQRRMARHVSYWQPCRRAAALAGLGDLVPQRTGARAKIAGFLPLPAAIRERWMGTGGHGSAHADGAGGGIAGWAHALMPAADAGGAGWAKVAATAATVAIAGFGAQQAVTGGGDAAEAESAVAAAAPERPAERAERTTTVAQRGGGGAAKGAARRTSGRAARKSSGRSGAGVAQGPRAAVRGGGPGGSGGRDAAASAGVGGSGASGDRGARAAGGGGGSAQAARDGDGTSAASGSGSRERRPSSGPVRDTASKVPTTSDVKQGLGEAVQQTASTAGQAVEETTKAAGDAVRQVTQTAGATVGQTTDVAGDTVRQTGNVVGDTVDQVGQAAPAVKPVTQAASETVRGATGAVGGLVQGTGRVVDQTTTSAGSAVAGVTERAGSSVDDVVGRTTKGLQATLGGG